MKIFAVTAGGRDYFFTDKVTATHFILKCKLASKANVREIIVHHPSMIDDLADTINESEYV